MHRFFFVLCLLTFCFAWYAELRGLELPQRQHILSDLAQAPQQEMLESEPFELNYKGKRYELQPVARYELWGLVVTHNDISAFTDIYHDETSIDFRDICVLWGKNLETNSYRFWEYWSEPWTCYMRTDSSEYFRDFRETALSNNHLLAESPAVAQEILHAKIGDQIHLRGLLVNYRTAGQGNPWRKSSIKRTDSGNGACEVIFVEDFSILRPANEYWRSLARRSWQLGAILAVLSVVFFLFDTYRR